MIKKKKKKLRDQNRKTWKNLGIKSAFTPTRYKRLNKITIIFGTELKPTKYIVVNYNFIGTNQICHKVIEKMLRNKSLDKGKSRTH